MTFEKAWAVVKMDPLLMNPGAMRHLYMATEPSPENNPAHDSELITHGGNTGFMHHVTSSDSHHYFVRANYDHLTNWAAPVGVNFKILKIPHEDWEQIGNAKSPHGYPHDEITPNKKKPWRTKSVLRPYNTGISIENWHLDDEDDPESLSVFRQRMKDAIEQAFVEKEIDADPAAFGYDE